MNAYLITFAFLLISLAFYVGTVFKDLDLKLDIPGKTLKTSEGEGIAYFMTMLSASAFVIVQPAVHGENDKAWLTAFCCILAAAAVSFLLGRRYAKRTAYKRTVEINDENDSAIKEDRYKRSIISIKQACMPAVTGIVRYGVTKEWGMTAVFVCMLLVLAFAWKKTRDIHRRHLNTNECGKVHPDDTNSQ
jgi:hypothetical protein